MKIIVSGSSGLVGSYLINFLTDKGHKISKLVRDPQKKTDIDILWNPLDTSFDPAHLEGFQAIIHLAGENISSRLWTKKQKERIKNSRVNSTHILANAISRLGEPKPVFLCASATGFYGDRGDEVLTENSAAGDGFLAEVVGEWEAACTPAIHSGGRVVNVRTGVVLSERGGMLKRLLPIFKIGLGGKLGNGQQYMPWISLVDLARIFEYCLTETDLDGPLNAVAPDAITNLQFTESLAEHLSRPVFLTIPEGVLRIFLGKLAKELLLASTNVDPKILKDKKFSFINASLESTWQEILS